jgi:hypothetical protein
MADSVVTTGRIGFTRLGPGDPSSNNGLSGIFLRGSDGFDRALWVDTNGKLRIADAVDVEAAAFNPDTSGVVAGSQT